MELNLFTFNFRQMIHILKNIVILIFVIVVIDISFGFFFKRFLFDKTISGESGGSLNFLLNKKQDVDYLVFGTSRAKHHIDPSLLTNLKGNGYNAGINGVGGIIYNTVLLDLCIQRNVKPNEILLQLDVINFCETPKNYNSSLIFLYPYFNESKILRDYIQRDGYKESFLAHSNLYRFNGKVLNVLFNYVKRNGVADNNGFVPLVETMDTSGQNEIKTDYAPLDFESINFKALTDFYKLCKENNIKLYFVFTPSCKNCMFSPQRDMEFSTYVTTNMPEVSMINLSDLKTCIELAGFENWKDMTHLNQEGAAKFSRILNDQFGSYFLKNVN
ncbi:MAG TPA: hypothetical protein PLU10_02120 [Chitinophagaceae bacterium]|nr:hypothetical protein [Chitinophagaceae bacterium]